MKQGKQDILTFQGLRNHDYFNSVAGEMNVQTIIAEYEELRGEHY